ncbi:unnamed protein product, partial [Didymodactylos carnosus]
MILSSKFESLPDELLLNVFSYLKPIDLYRAFFNLNIRINYILNDSYLKFHLDFDNVPVCEYDLLCEYVMDQISTRLHSIKLSNSTLELFFTQFDFDKFPYLTSMSLIKLTTFEPNETNIFFQQLLKIRLQLSHLLIIECQSVIEIDLYKIIFSNQLPKLKSCQLIFRSDPIDFGCLGKICICNQLEHLTIDKCDFDQLLYLLQYLPKMRYLQASIIGSVTISGKKDLADLIPYLNQLKLTVVRFDYFEYFIQHIPQLTFVSLIYLNAYQPIISGEYLANLLLTSLPSLMRFNCTIPDFKFDYITFIGTFQHQMYLDRKNQWIIKHNS